MSVRKTLRVRVRAVVRLASCCACERKSGIRKSGNQETRKICSSCTTSGQWLTVPSSLKNKMIHPRESKRAPKLQSKRERKSETEPFHSKDSVCVQYFSGLSVADHIETAFASFASTVCSGRQVVTSSISVKATFFHFMMLSCSGDSRQTVSLLCCDPVSTKRNTTSLSSSAVLPCKGPVAAFTYYFQAARKQRRTTQAGMETRLLHRQPAPKCCLNFIEIP